MNPGAHHATCNICGHTYVRRDDLYTGAADIIVSMAEGDYEPCLDCQRVPA